MMTQWERDLTSIRNTVVGWSWVLGVILALNILFGIAIVASL